jgi:two-component system OmpR family sensor kinase
MKRRWLAVIGIIAPAGLGFLIAILFEQDILTNRVFVGRYAADFVWIMSRAGVLISLVFLCLLLGYRYFVRQVELARQEERAIQMKHRRQFMQRLDHELKNPLTIIRLGVTNWQHSPDLTPEQMASAQRVNQQVDRLQKLIIDLRQLTDLEDYHLEEQPINLRDVLQEAVDASSPDQADHKVTLQVQEVPWPVGVVFGDRDLLVMALHNVISNALKYTNDDGSVEIRAMDDGRSITIEVADNGIGIPADAVDHIFEELYRGKNAKQVSGSGLGLSLVERIIAMHGGTISIRSREAQGTVVSVRLPLASSE